MTWHDLASVIMEYTSGSRRLTPRRRNDPTASLAGTPESDLAQRAAASDCTILLVGETGTGKGHFAKWIHANSPRHDLAFVPVNCGAIPESLIDSQLFGHTRGAFSGATTEHLGLVRAADQGTLFLDEVSELSSSAQLRLLRLLQEHEVQPVGRSRPIMVDVRVVAATNIDLHQMVTEGEFREDLLFRLDVIRMVTRPLRDRLDDVPDLLDAFVHEFAGIYKRPPLEFDRQAMRMMLAHDWPGNIRQLRTVIERLYVLNPDERVTADRLRRLGQLHRSSEQATTRSLKQVKMEEVLRILAQSDGSVSRTADHFGVHRSTLYRWLRSRSELGEER